MVHDDAVLRVCLEQAWSIVTCSGPWQRRLVRALRAFFDEDVWVYVAELGWPSADAPASPGWIQVATPYGDLGRREITLRGLSGHPGLRRMVGGHARPQRLSDLVDLPRFRRTEMFARTHGQHPPGTRFAAAVPLGLRSDGITLLGGHRHRRDFDATDMHTLELVGTVIPPAVAFRTAVDHVAAHTTPGPAASGPGRAPQEAGAARVSTYRPTPRERDVLMLLVQGLTNRQIARKLDITERTVRKHLDSVYTQGDLTGRAAAAAWWGRLSPSPG